MLILISLFALTAQLAQSQNPSPCPQIFSYEPRVQEEDRWYGVISLQTLEDLDGVWLKVILDRPAELLGNWFGETVSSDNQEFTIKNPRYKLEAGPPVSVRFFVKYNLAATIPSVNTIRLNGKTICTSGREEVATTTPQLHISQIRPNGGSKVTRPSNTPAGRPSDEGAFLNNREPVSSSNYGSSMQERPSSYGTSSHERPTNVGTSTQQRPTNVGTSTQQRPTNVGTSTQQRPTNGGTSTQQRPANVGTSTQQRPSNVGTSTQQRPANVGTSTQQRPSNNNYGNGNHRGSSQERPDSYNSQESSSHEIYTTSRRPSSSQSNTITNNQREPSDSGDFAIHRPTHSRPPSRPSSVSKRNVACGTVGMKASPLISYGQNTTQGQWPWHAALYHTQGAQLTYTCGATLISENHILTAAHCVAKPQTNRPIDTRRLTVYLGKHSLKKFGTGTQDREVSDIFIHPQYNYSVYFNDIAVLKLKNSADITNYVRPCCLWEGAVDLEYVLNKLGTVVGWGFDEKRQISDTLMQAQMPVVSTVNCIYSNREFFSQFTFEKTYCAGFRNDDSGTTVCNGDSGGGMVFPRSGTNGQNTVWQIRGIVSVGVALQGQGVCDPKHYIVFTDVAKHVDWIKQVMNE
ncbi:serine proteinase stubble-like isoform X3 [Zophobas morio]|uniref:serine proteinase stubble-like isoform X3 n=1 Tax=Zophobas morio TaxID=2755281 RepID=UPI003083E80C